MIVIFVTYFIASTLIILSGLGLALMFYNAPEGYEDKDGFHYGEKK